MGFSKGSDMPEAGSFTLTTTTVQPPGFAALPSIPPHPLIFYPSFPPSSLPPSPSLLQLGFGVPEAGLGGHAFHTYQLLSPDGRYEVRRGEEGGREGEELEPLPAPSFADLF